MKLLIICDQPNAIPLPKSQGKINTLNTIYAYIISKKLREFKYDVSVTFLNIRTIPDDKLDTIGHYDVIFSTVNRGISILRPIVVEALKKKCNKLATICESASVVGPEDYLFHIIGHHGSKCIRTSWGADHSMLKCNKDANVLRILVDHPYYGKKKSNDKTQIIIDSLLEFARSVNGKIGTKQLLIRHISNNELVTIDYSKQYQIKPFVQTNGVDFRDVYSEYEKTDIFVVTHQESFGFTPIECAATGSLIVYPKDFLRHSMIRNLHSYTIPDINNKPIDWTEIISRINVKKSIEKSMFYSYDKLVHKMAQVFEWKKIN